MPIVLQESLRGLFYAPFYAALALEAYAEEGVEVTFAPAPPPGDAGKGLSDGTIDVTWGGPMRLMQIYAREPSCDLVCFGEAVTRDPFLLVGRGPKAGFKLADLAHVRLATVAEVPTPWMCLQEDLRRAGLDPATLNRHATGTMGENMAALRESRADVVQLFEPLVSELLEDQRFHVWYAAADRGPTSYTTFYARRPLLAEKRDECQRMVRALHRTLMWVSYQSPGWLAEVIAPYFPDVPRQRMVAALQRYKQLGIWGQSARLPQSGYERLRQSLVSGGFVATGIPFETAVDNALAEAVIREGPPALAR